MKLIIINVNARHSNEITLGAALSLGCIIGFFVGGWISQYLGKRTMMVLSNFASFIIWLMLAFGTDRVSFIIIERFSMGVFSAAAVGCVGEFFGQVLSSMYRMIVLEALLFGQRTGKNQCF